MTSTNTTLNCEVETNPTTNNVNVEEQQQQALSTCSNNNNIVNNSPVSEEEKVNGETKKLDENSHANKRKSQNHHHKREESPIIYKVQAPEVILFNSPKMVLDKMKVDGIRKSKLTVDQIIILSLFAGLFIGLACAMAILVGGNVPDLEEKNPGLQKLLSGAVFPIGLILIAMTGSELFTGNVLVLLVALFSRKWRAKKFLIQYTQFSKNLFVSYLFNCLGAFLFAYFFVYLPQPCCSAYWIKYIQNLSVSKTSKTFGNLVLLAIICNMLVTVSVFCCNAATTLGGKFIGIWFPLMTFVCLGFEHSIANAFYIPLGMLYGANVTGYDFLIGNLLPVTIGNIIGGAIINGCLLYYVHDFRVRHHRAIFNFAEKMWEKIKKRKEMTESNSSTSIELSESKENMV